MRSDGRTALVTGAARGIALAIARRLTGDGHRVALLDLDLSAGSGKGSRCEAAEGGTG